MQGKGVEKCKHEKHESTPKFCAHWIHRDNVAQRAQRFRRVVAAVFGSKIAISGELVVVP